MLIEGEHPTEGMLGDEGNEIALLRTACLLGEAGVRQAIAGLGRE